MTPRTWLRGLRSATKLMTSLRSRDGVRRSRLVAIGEGLRRLEALEDRSCSAWAAPFPDHVLQAHSQIPLSFKANQGQSSAKSVSWLRKPRGVGLENLGSHALTATLNHSNYQAAIARTRTLAKAQSHFSSLADRTITYGGGRTTVSGKITSGPLIPPAACSSPQGRQTCGEDKSVGDFTATFNTARLPAGSYAITYRYLEVRNSKQPGRLTTFDCPIRAHGSNQPGKRQHCHRS